MFIRFATVLWLVVLVAFPQTKSPSTMAAALTYRRIWAGSDVPTGWLSVASDGQQVAFVTDSTLWVRDLSSGRLQRLADSGSALAAAGPLAWAPDATQLAYLAQGGKLVVVNRDGSNPKVVYRVDESQTVWPTDWSPDGQRLLATLPQTAQQPGEFVWIRIKDGNVQRMSAPASPEYGARVSPDGLFVFFSARQGSRSTMYLAASDGSRVTPLPQAPLAELPVGWSPNGQQVLSFRGATVWATPIRQGQPTGQAVLVQRDLARGREYAPALRADVPIRPLGITRSGALLYENFTDRSDIYTALMNAAGKVTSSPVPVALSHPGFNAFPRWSPDGKRILYHMIQWLSETFIYSFEDRTDRRVNTAFKGVGNCWATDREVLTFGTGGGANVQIDTGAFTPLAASGETFSTPSCSGDLAVNNKQSGIYVRNLKTGAEREIYNLSSATGITAPTLSHDGSTVAFVAATDSDSTALLVIPSQGGNPRELVKLKRPAEFQQIYYGATWSPDDRYVYFLKKEDHKAPYALCRVPGLGGEVQEVGLRVPDVRDIDIARDGLRIVFSIGAMRQPEIWSMENFLSGDERYNVP